MRYWLQIVCRNKRRETRQNIKRKSLSGEYTVWIEFFLQRKTSLFPSRNFFFGFVCQDPPPPPTPRSLRPKHSFYLLLYEMFKRTRYAFSFSFHLFLAIINFFTHKTSGNGSENPNKAAGRPWGDVASLCPTRRSRSVDSSNKLKACFLHRRHISYSSFSYSRLLFPIGFEYNSKVEETLCGKEALARGKRTSLLPRASRFEFFCVLRHLQSVFVP